MHNHLDEMEMLGLVELEKRNEGLSGGYYKMVNLDQDLELVVDALEETMETVSVHEAVESEYPSQS